MKNSGRRSFLMISVSGAGLWSSESAKAHENQGGVRVEIEDPMLSPKDPIAISLGYIEDGKDFDKKKHPLGLKGQACKVCSHYMGAEEEKAGGCHLFAGKRVMANGWCSGFLAKKS